MLHAPKQQVTTYVAALIIWNLGPQLESDFSALGLYESMMQALDAGFDAQMSFFTLSLAGRFTGPYSEVAACAEPVKAVAAAAAAPIIISRLVMGISMSIGLPSLSGMTMSSNPAI